MTVSDAQRHCALEAENAKSKKLLAEQMLGMRRRRIWPQNTSDAECEAVGRALPGGGARAERASGLWSPHFASGPITSREQISRRP